MLTIPDEIKTLVASGQYSLAVMIQADLDEGSQGLWTEYYDVTVGGVPFSGIGGNIKSDDFTGDGALNVNNFHFQISGLAQSARNIIDNMNWHQRPATVFIAFLDDSRQIRFQLPRYSGFLDQAPISDADASTCVMDVTIENNNRDLDRASGRIRSDSDQRAVGGSTDDFGKYIATSNTDTDIYWGRKGPQSPVR